MRRGFTLLEVVISSGIAAIVIVGLLTFYSRIVIVSREQFEQERIAEDARIQLDRISDTLRNAKQLDCDGDGDTSSEGEYWLQEAGPYQIVVYSNVDEDDQIEKVRYAIDSSDTGEQILLKRGVIQPGSTICDFTGMEQEATVLGSIRNVASGTALFDYYANESSSSLLTLPTILTNVKRIHLNLLIDAVENILPNAAKIETDVVPRGEVCSGAGCLAGAACTIPSGVLDSYSYNNDPFMDDAFSNCLSYCATTSVPAGECCAWRVGFNVDDELGVVSTYCECGGGPIPLGEVVASPDLGQYTDFFRNCYKNFCGGNAHGYVVCDAGCLDKPGACSCSCD